MSFDRGVPCPRPVVMESRGEARGFDVDDLPTLAKRRPDLGLRDPSRPTAPRFLVAETEQMEDTARIDDVREAVDISCPLRIVERVKQSAVEYRGEGLPESCELEGVGDDEFGGNLP